MILLASASPRRAEILASLGIPFRVVASSVPEEIRPGESAEAAVMRLAAEKAEAIAALHPGAPVLGADTVVVLGAEILGKPRDAEDARRMLTRLSGKVHRVATGVCVMAPRGREERCEVSEVAVAPLTDKEIDWYVRTGEGMGKAGGYAVQGLAARFIEEVRGSYTNVVGLPARTVYRMLCGLGLGELALPGIGA